MEILYHKDLDYKSVTRTFFKELEHLKNGNFAAAEVKKMPETNLYRAKLDYSNRLLFRIAKYNGQTYLLLLEVILNHDYSKSKFLRGAVIDENKLLPLQGIEKIDPKDLAALPYVNPNKKHFHLLDKIICFDDEQDETLHMPPPLIVIGSAGSGKTALALEKVKSLAGNILYVTLSPYLSEHASRLYYSNNYENESQEIDFLSFREFIETIRIPQGKQIGFRDFEQWFLPHRHHTKVKDANKLFEEFSGVLTGYAVDKEFLTREEYINLGVRQSIFLNEERGQVYDLFEKYLQMLREKGFYDINMIANQWTVLCQPRFDFIIVDEVQDYTNVQLFLILRSLKQPSNFILCGDSNQIVHPNFFSWSKIKSMFYHHLPGQNASRVLSTNYRNSPQVTGIANRLLKIKNQRFGSIDRESTYLIRPVSARPGEVQLLDDSERVKKEFNDKTRQSTRFAVLVMRNEDKAEAAKYFNTPLLFSVQEAKGLEYENILLFNFVSDNESIFREITRDIDPQDIAVDELSYSRASDKADKSLEAYKFYINSLFVAMTRAVGNLYIVEKNHKQAMLSLLDIHAGSQQLNIQQQISSKEEWQREAQRLEKQGKTEQADLIRKTILGTQQVPWTVITVHELAKIKLEALNPESFNKKAKDKIFDYAMIYGDDDIIRTLAELKYKRAENPDAERKSLLRRFYQNYVADNAKQLMPEVNKYGVDFRNEYNQTPLMVSAWTGSTSIAQYLLALGAKTELVDNVGRNALQTALLQTYLHAEYAKNKLGKIYPLVVTEGMNVKIDNHLVKINNHQAEYLLLNLLIAAQRELIKRGDASRSFGFTSGGLAGIFENYPENILPSFRKKQQYISAILAKNEVSREDQYNKKLFLRLERGYYVINPELEMQIDGQWTNIYTVMRAKKMTPEHNKELMKTQLNGLLQFLQIEQKRISDLVEIEWMKDSDHSKAWQFERQLTELRKEKKKLLQKISELNEDKTTAPPKAEKKARGHWVKA